MLEGLRDPLMDGVLLPAVEGARLPPLGKGTNNDEAEDGGGGSL